MAPDDDPPLFTQGDVTIARSYFQVSTTVYPLFLTHNVRLEARPERPERPAWTSLVGFLARVGLAVAFLPAVILVVGLGVAAYSRQLSRVPVPLLIITVAITVSSVIISCVLEWLCTQAPDLVSYRIEAGDEVGNRIEVLSWEMDEGALNLAVVLAATAGLDLSVRVILPASAGLKTIDDQQHLESELMAKLSEHSAKWKTTK